MKKQKFKTLIALLLAGFLLVGCKPNPTPTSNEPTTSDSASQSEYKVTISAIGSTEIAVSKTVQLRSTVVGTTEKDVTWESIDPTIASVNERGLVTGLKAGEAQIKAILKVDPRATATIKITVTPGITPTQLIISGATSGTAWVNEDVKLTVTAVPVEASSLVTWESSDESVAQVTSDGSVTFLKAGDVVIMATSVDDEAITAYLSFNVKKGTFYSNKGSRNWNIDNQAAAINPSVHLPAAGSSGYNALYFNHFMGERYYFEAFFKTGPLTPDAWAWHGIGVGSGLSDSDSRFFTFSPFAPNQGNNHNKTILRDMPTIWGGLTDRSQVWGEHGLNQITSSEGLKIALLRDFDTYYYLINDELHWVDITTKYAGTPTYPLIVGFDMEVTVSEYILITEEMSIDEKLNDRAFSKSFFTSGTNVTYVDDSDFSFNTTQTMSKDHKVRSIGDKTKLIGDFEISFEVENMAFNAEKNTFTGLSVNLARYDDANVNESIMIGQSDINADKTSIFARFQSWDFVKSMEDSTAVIKYAESTTPVKDDPLAKSTVSIKRIIDEQKATFVVTIDEVEVIFDVGSSLNAEASVYYTGAYLMWIGGEYSSSNVSNFIFKTI